MLQLRIQQQDGILIIDKPSGISTHAPEPFRLGLVEFLSDILGFKVYVVHRLDQDTSGVMVFAIDSNSASLLAEAFANRKVKKNYDCITSSTVDSTTFTIAPESNLSASSLSSESQAISHFSQIQHNRDAACYRWKISIDTGKTHQIRKHARDKGIPIVGDNKYGGSPSPNLHLHSSSLTIDQSTFTSPPPLWIQACTTLDISLRGCLSLAIDRRKRLYEWSPEEAFRLSAYESPKVVIDKLGSFLWCYWYRQNTPNEEDFRILEAVSHELNCQGFYLRLMHNRGSPHAFFQDGLFRSHSSLPSHWQVEEQGINLLCKSTQGYSPGVFVDQRSNRRWLFHHCAGAKVLNLFSYSGAFTISALKGGAHSVTSVDTSNDAHSWAKENIALNVLDNDRCFFFRGDVREFLKLAKKRVDTFDFIIIDPPTFARSKKGIFRVEDEWRGLVKSSWSLLNLGGTILFSTNCELLSPENLQRDLSNLVPFSSVVINRCDPDCTLGASPGTYPLRSFLLEKVR